MNFKFTLKVLDESGNVTKEKVYKTLREIAKDLNIDYHQVRELNKITEGKINKKFLHSTLKELSEVIKIYDIKYKLNIEELNII